jgi:hypothetical protein
MIQQYLVIRTPARGWNDAALSSFVVLQSTSRAAAIREAANRWPQFFGGKSRYQSKPTAQLFMQEIVHNV